MSGASVSHDAYLAKVPAAFRSALETLRRIIRGTAPEAIECMSYGLPAFRHEGRPLVAYGAAREHCALYPMSAKTIAAHAADLEGFATSKGTIRFEIERPLPEALVRKLVKARIAENRERA